MMWTTIFRTLFRIYSHPITHYRALNMEKNLGKKNESLWLPLLWWSCGCKATTAAAATATSVRGTVRA